ncbi:MAG: PKD domain-containing protein, partial [Bacteroidia bacterium]
MFVHTNGNLYILGFTISNDFPVSAGAFDATHNGLLDIFVSELNATGSILMASTYIGGSNDDAPQIFGNKGDISVNNSGDVFVVSTTQSTNFPVTAGCFQPVTGGGYDAVIFSLQPGLTNLNYSTYLGGSGDEKGEGFTLDATGTEVIVCGTTGSSDFPAQASAFQPLYSGGTSDGFITHINAAGTAILASTFFGTTSGEGISFIDADASGNIYILGAAFGTLGAPITAGVYSNPGSSAFITKFDAQLQTMIFSTQIGSGNLLFPSVFSPTAFLIDECEYIHLAGFGDFGPTTANALYTAANSPGSLYIAVLAKDALALNHATLFSGDHIEGSLCRFDQAGTIYHAFCQGVSPFPTPVWAFAPTGPFNSYDVCGAVISFPPSGVLAQAAVLPGDTGCAPFAVTFNNSSNGINYYWDFGDGSPLDTTASPSHTFLNPGTYTVTLIAEDSSSCIIRDTLTLSITVLATPQILLGNDTTFCSSVTPLLLNAGNPGLTYTWSTGATTQTITATVPGIYWVVADNGICNDTDSITIALINEPPAMTDTAFCQNQQLTLTTGAGQSWL